MNPTPHGWRILTREKMGDFNPRNDSFSFFSNSLAFSLSSCNCLIRSLWPLRARLIAHFAIGISIKATSQPIHANPCAVPIFEITATVSLESKFRVINHAFASKKHATKAQGVNPESVTRKTKTAAMSRHAGRSVSLFFATGYQEFAVSKNFRQFKLIQPKSRLCEVHNPAGNRDYILDKRRNIPYVYRMKNDIEPANKGETAFDADDLNLISLAQEYANEDKARELLERLRWPNGAICPHCKNDGKVKPNSKLTPKAGSKSAVRKGVYFCGACRKQFTVTVKTVFEGSHIPISKWLMAWFIVCSSKKSVSAHQLHRMLKITYKAAWFMAHRIRFAFGGDTEKLGGLKGGKARAAALTAKRRKEIARKAAQIRWLKPAQQKFPPSGNNARLRDLNFSDLLPEGKMVK
jgi:transposase-like protein